MFQAITRRGIGNSPYVNAKLEYKSHPDRPKKEIKNEYLPSVYQHYVPLDGQDWLGSIWLCEMLVRVMFDLSSSRLGCNSLGVKLAGLITTQTYR